ncbi:hypothetical protein [Novosphingobium sp. AP12]|uniref:hypothetical protein n=1 Tax=Novosphingobium sp. AP12 TaxID=1144305 RepID=UPI000271D90D|nr:hypothetical protein [Novosphingobium sp. AP12]EJL24858.1 hypothetical protein PMI02_03533 [Novosphingobium sp. AP12]
MQDISAPVAPTPDRSRSRGPTLFIALIAFLLGAALVAWFSARGYLAVLNPQVAAPVEVTTPAPPPEPAAQMAAIGTVEGRLAMIEDRISRIDFETNAAAGNAGRAEGLLIAFAARRMVDRGEPLGHVADQLRLRFMNAQPRAVQTVIDFAANPVTIDGLAARLEALSPELTVTQANESLWDRARHEVTSMFTVRRDSGTLATPAARIDRARVMLTARRIDSAVGEVERLPGADAADTWIADARRFEAAQKALDLLETTAMLEPSRLQDSAGQAVDQPSPLAPVAPQGEPTESAAE